MPQEFQKNIKDKSQFSPRPTNGGFLNDNRQKSIQKKANKTGLPDQLKSGIESLSGHSMDDVKVHYNSAKPAQLNAHAYAQGNQIHLGSGQEKHLAHEAWHVVQQRQGRVKPTKQMKDKVNVNDDVGLEKEADIMGRKAETFQTKTYQPKAKNIMPSNTIQQVEYQWDTIIQRVANEEVIQPFLINRVLAAGRALLGAATVSTTTIIGVLLTGVESLVEYFADAPQPRGHDGRFAARRVGRVGVRNLRLTALFLQLATSAHGLYNVEGNGANADAIRLTYISHMVMILAAIQQALNNGGEPNKVLKTAMIGLSFIIDHIRGRLEEQA